ncbi:MAG: 4Fe-4S dicluster domain-containing protein [Candidatus Asgardarchaeia archaeon]
MEVYKIKKENLPKFIDMLKQEYKVFGPKDVNGELIFGELDKGNEFVDEKTLLSPKDIIYPQIEEFLKIKRKNGDYKVEFQVDTEKKVVLGVRACDMRAFQRLDKTFKNDVFFKARRENTILIPFSCTKPCNSGFCKDLGGPSLRDGFHLQFTDIGEYYLVEVGTEKGRKIINKFRELFEEGTEEDIAKKNEIINKVLDELPDIKVKGVHQILDWNDPIIEEYANKCISCGACNYACPSCFCYNVADIVYDGEISRVRDWDSCLLPGFTRLAGGENPRKEAVSRMRQRLFHKFKYFYEIYGEYHCTGCGRCYEVCPVNIDLRDFLRRVWGRKK